jgi:chorismate mutase
MSQDQSTGNVEVRWREQNFDLKSARTVLNVLDEQLLILIQRRVSLGTAVVRSKLKAGVDATDKVRETEMAIALGEVADRYDLDRTFVSNIIQSLISESKIRGRQAHAQDTGDYLGVE